MGSCVAGGAYLPIMSDESLIVDRTGTIFLAGSYLVKAAIGEDIDNEILGGATTHTEISGVCDYNVSSDEDCIETIRGLMDKIGETSNAGFNRKTPSLPKRDLKDIYGVLPAERSKPYNMKDLIKCMVDDSKIIEYKASYGKTIICAYARIDGWSVGIVANQREIVKTAKGQMRFGGYLFDSADKAARFIMNCNQKKIPLVFFKMLQGLWLDPRVNTMEL